MKGSIDINELFTVEYLAKQPAWVKILVFVVVALLTFSIITIGAFKYFDFSNLFQAQKTTEDQKLSTLASRLEFKAHAEQYLVEIEQINKLLTEVRKKLPTDLNAGNFIEQLNMNANQAGINVHKSIPSNSSSQGFYTRFPVRIEGCATYDQIGRFVANLSEIERIITLENFGLNSYMATSELPREISSRPGVGGVTVPSIDCKASGKQAFSALIATYQYKL